jgi:3'-phosphoadenosine 5'-phosphosulfate sulfotransferase (PAPS reductase)/FAD synthetase
MRRHVVALSFGADSTAMALRLQEIGCRRYEFVCTPTGNELPEMVAHCMRVEALLGQPIQRLPGHTLEDYMEQWNALPNSKMRWCTRLLKIVPFLAAVKNASSPVIYVGLRADEPERKGLYSEDVETRFPLREWGWDRADVLRYLDKRGVSIPKRTDCAWCYGQRLSEWYQLWQNHPDIYERGVQWEKRTGHTFRSASRDTWPASLEAMRQLFKEGKRPTRSKLPDRNVQFGLFGGTEDDDGGACRICRM